MSGGEHFSEGRSHLGNKDRNHPRLPTTQQRPELGPRPCDRATATVLQSPQAAAVLTDQSAQNSVNNRTNDEAW